MSDLLVIKPHIALRQKEYNHLYKALCDMKHLGVVLVPSYCDVIVVPEDVEVKVEEENYGRSSESSLSSE